MEKLDLTKKYKTYYQATAMPELIVVEPVRYLSIKGKGDPSGKKFSNVLQGLYATAYAIKFMCKAQDNDFVVPKLEGLWSFDETKYKGLSIIETPLKVPRSEWDYTMLIRMPDFVTEEQVETAKQAVVTKKQIPLAGDVELLALAEGKVVQMLHTGPFANEQETLLEMMAFMEAKGLQKNGLHHEIYLSDFNKTAPDRLKTILREPVK